jgi:hypothetical protein
MIGRMQPAFCPSCWRFGQRRKGHARSPDRHEGTRCHTINNNVGSGWPEGSERMKKSKAEIAETLRRIVMTAAAEFRRVGG